MNRTFTDCCPGVPIPAIELRLEDDHIVALAPGRFSESFRLPALPLSLLSAAYDLQTNVLAHHHRCLAAVLMLELGAMRWRIRVPGQQSMPDGVSWSVSQADLADLPPTTVFAGSIQTCVDDRAADLLGCVPFLDGIHVVHAVMDDEQALVGFARVAGEIEVIDLKAFVANDEPDESGAAESCVPFL